jgi:protein subunit release factor B
MKKALYMIGIFAFALTFTSCNKVEADKDVDNSINKMKQFNELFDKLYEDGVISKEAKDKEESEFDQLKAVANEYYEIINKINNNIKEDNENVERGKKSNNYEEAYKKALDERKDDIKEVTKIFEDNLNKIEPIEVDIILEENLEDETSEDIEEKSEIIE